MSYYDELGVKQDATNEEIRAAFRRKAKQLHPDRKDGAAEKMAAVNKAYETLSQPQRRLTYDRTGEDRPPDEARIARDLVLSNVMEWMTSSSNSGDMVKDVTARFINEQTKLLGQIIEGTALLKRLTKRAKRLKFRGKGPDFARIAIDTKIREIKHQIERIRDQTTNLDRAKEMLNGSYEYDPETVAMATVTLSNFRGSRGLE